ncbi:MAG TPA: SpoIIE family protein phosphatase [Spirochaetota bacterium]|nr:SpoIIE family protein phosphatase [Spirochaetota bacterium]HPQ49296.1 SpoIIE family protein phosphatase [Spirochaetota bacterium]
MSSIVKNLIFLFVLILFYSIITLLLNFKVESDRKLRKKTTNNIFILLFGFSSSFLVLDLWLLLSSVGIYNTFGWWGGYAFLIGVLVGIFFLSMVYKRLQYSFKRYKIYTPFDFLSFRYPGFNFISKVANYIFMLAFFPMIFFQVKVLQVLLFPDISSYLGLAIIIFPMLILFLFNDNKDKRVPYLFIAFLGIVFMVAGIFANYNTISQLYFIKPKISNFLVAILLGFSFYLIMPRNFSAYSYKKIDFSEIDSTRRKFFISLIIGVILLLNILPLGGFYVSNNFLSLILVLTVACGVGISQLFAIKSIIYSGLKRYNTYSMMHVSIISIFIYVILTFLFNYFIELKNINYSRLYIWSISILPIIVVPYIGGLFIKRARSINFYLSLIAGLIVWYHMVVNEEILGFTISLLKIKFTTETQIFYPFLASLIFFIIPLPFIRKAPENVRILLEPESIVIESFLEKYDDYKSLLYTKEGLKVFILFFDRKNEFFTKEFLVYITKLPRTRLTSILEALKKFGFIEQYGEYYTYKRQDKEFERLLDKLIIGYHAVENLLRYKAEKDFEEYRINVIKKTDEIETHFNMLELLNEVSKGLSNITSFNELYRKITSLVVNNLGFECSEFFMIKKNNDKYEFVPVSLFFSNYRHLMSSLDFYSSYVKNNEYMMAALNKAINENIVVINDPKEIEKLNTLEKYSSIGFSLIVQDNQPFAILVYGYMSEGRTVTSSDLQKIDFIINNLTQTSIIISLYESLEEKIRQRTAELEKANQELKVFNQKLSALNKEIKREMMTASSIQKAILPSEFPYPDYVEIAAKLKAMPDLTLTEEERKRIDISGDYYDVFDMGDGKIGILIADVTGHGIPSALITTMAKISFYTHAIDGGSTAEICDRVNKDIYEAIGIGDTGFYVTVFFSIYDTKTGKIQFTNAGHHKGILVRNNGRIEYLDTQGFFIGSFEGVEYNYGEAYFDEGDTFILYTDGIVEQKSEKDEFYEEIFYNKLSSISAKKPSEFVEHIFSDIDVFRGSYPIKDDMTLIVLRVKKVIERPTSEKTSANITEISSLIKDIIEEYNSKKKLSDKNLSVLNNIIDDVNNPTLYYIKAMIEFKENNFEISSKYFKKALSLLKQPNTILLNNAGVSFYKTGDYQEAKKCWDKVLSIDPNNANALKNIKLLENKKLT